MANDKMMKMLMKKKKESSPLSDSDKKSKLEALQGMRGMANSMMGDKLKNLKKVTVASDSAPGLEEGLEKAQDMIKKPDESYSEGGSVDDQMPEGFDTDDDESKKEGYASGGMAEGSDDESQEHDSVDELVEESPDDADELDQLIQKLEEKKRNLQK